MNPTEKFSDRSRFNEYQRCPRARYLGYEWGGVGLRRNRVSIPLATGAHFHTGIAHVLNQVLQLGDAPHVWQRVDVDAAVAVATDEYRAELKDRGLDVELGEDAQAVADEQIGLTEGLIRAYVKAPGGLQALLEQYRVLEVEREDTWERFTNICKEIGLDTPVTFQSRADALLQERTTNDLYLLSFKTAAQFDWRKDNENRHDVQGLSEAVVVERRLRQDWEVAKMGVGSPAIARVAQNASYCEWLRSLPDPPRIMGIQMVFLVKGIRRQAYDGGPYETSSPLLRGWYKEGITEREYAWKEELPCPGPGHVLRETRKGPVLCEGKKFHKLGQDWQRFKVLGELGGVKWWIDALASGTVQADAGDPFESIVQMPLPYFRQDRDLQDWVEQAQAQEQLVAAAAADVERCRVEAPHALHRLLNISFPQNRRSCDWPSACQFQPICFGDPSMETNPMASGLFQLRVPHHQPELDAQKEKV